MIWNKKILVDVEIMLCEQYYWSRSNTFVNIKDDENASFYTVHDSRNDIRGEL